MHAADAANFFRQATPLHLPYEHWYTPLAGGENLAKFPRGLHDPCGSTKALGTRWETSNAPDLITPGDLVVQLTLEVYHFRPKAPHGDASCADKFE